MSIYNLGSNYRVNRGVSSSASHPTLNLNRPHKGQDFGAAAGTLIPAEFDGKAILKKYKNRVLIVLVCILTLLGCDMDPVLPSPPVNTPIALDNGGEVVEFDFKVSENYRYDFGLMYFFNNDIKSDADTLLKLIGWHNSSGAVLVEVDFKL